MTSYFLIRYTTFADLLQSLLTAMHNICQKQIDHINSILTVILFSGDMSLDIKTAVLAKR